MRFQSIPDHCDPAWHLFAMAMPDGASRDRIISHLGSRGILSVFHYQPLHSSTMGRMLGGRPGRCPVAENTGECLVRLPFFNSLTDQEQDEIIAAVMEA